jgi:hypothetical protein
VDLINYEYADTEDELQSHQGDLDRRYRFSDNFSQLADPNPQFDHELWAEDEFQPNGFHPSEQFQPSYQFAYDGHRSEPATMDHDHPVEAARPLSPIAYSESDYHSNNTSMNDVMDVMTNSHGFSVNSMLSIDSLDRLSEIRRHGPALYGAEQAEVAAFNEENGTDWQHSELGYGRSPAVHPEVEISSPPPVIHRSISRPISTKLPPQMMVGLGAHPAVLEGEKGAKEEKGKGMARGVKGRGKSGVKLGWMLRIFGRRGKAGRWI